MSETRTELNKQHHDTSCLYLLSERTWPFSKCCGRIPQLSKLPNVQKINRMDKYVNNSWITFYWRNNFLKINLFSRNFFWTADHFIEKYFLPLGINSQRTNIMEWIRAYETAFLHVCFYHSIKEVFDIIVLTSYSLCQKIPTQKKFYWQFVVNVSWNGFFIDVTLGKHLTLMFNHEHFQMSCFPGSVNFCWNLMITQNAKISSNVKATYTEGSFLRICPLTRRYEAQFRTIS